MLIVNHLLIRVFIRLNVVSCPSFFAFFNYSFKTLLQTLLTVKSSNKPIVCCLLHK